MAKGTVRLGKEVWKGKETGRAVTGCGGEGHGRDCLQKPFCLAAPSDPLRGPCGLREWAIRWSFCPDAEGSWWVEAGGVDYLKPQSRSQKLAEPGHPYQGAPATPWKPRLAVGKLREGSVWGNGWDRGVCGGFEGAAPALHLSLKQSAWEGWLEFKDSVSGQQGGVCKFFLKVLVHLKAY